jgi:hypothetical protein
MARPNASFAVENHPQKPQILQQMIDGVPLRAISGSLVPRISVMALQRYKVNVVNKIVARTTVRTIPKERPVPDDRNPVTVQTVEQAVHDAPVVSLFRARLEKLHGRVDKALTQAESAVTVIQDEDGELKAVGRDLKVLAPLFGQAHKNLEILGRATGELEPQGSPPMAIQIICPQAPNPGAMPRISFQSRDAIELQAADDDDDTVPIGIQQK